MSEDQVLNKNFVLKNTSCSLADVDTPTFDHQTYMQTHGDVIDKKHLEKLQSDVGPFFNLYIKECDLKSCFRLKVYNISEKIPLHKLVTVSENLGLVAMREKVFRIHYPVTKKVIYVQELFLCDEEGEEFQPEEFKHKFEDALLAIYDGKLESDIINKLIIKAGLNWREVFLLRAYCKYLSQIKVPQEQAFIKKTLVKNARITKLFVKLFHVLFDPEQASAPLACDVENEIHTLLSKVAISSEDKVLRKVWELIKCTSRTNFYQKNRDGKLEDYVSFKFNNSAMTGLPLPKPFAEIFVYSQRVVGMHLRGGKVSRGGIRWSDRVDTRTEILALMKAQMTKNTIIVPDGAKGGFLVKKSASLQTKEDVLKEGIECYKIFLRGMLDLTDNIVGGKVVRPPYVICRDGKDPYLVVAADKGTANFSDIANKVAKDYNFWLEDAFASGGSMGYSHKEMGITARGTWISVLEHFSQVDIDPTKDEFTAVGIGDMSGDVFGNGMLLSDKMKLIAAFNHQHIFIDPAPDSVKSYKERERLFKLPSSAWTDYDSQVISKGGGVFSRHAKTILLSKEIKHLFKINRNTVSPEELIKLVLTANVDLLWNGGIGTYVKSETESNEQIDDRANDFVRVNAMDLRCKVVGEGGNLGFTQLARVEYALLEGLINSDFVDNSGGVDCSDHEVNIKMVLKKAFAAKRISEKERKTLLSNMQEKVAQLVFHNNRVQNINVSVSAEDSKNSLELYVKLMQILADEGELDTQLECLPNEAEINRRIQQGIGLTRPETAILLSYSKRKVYESLIDSVGANEDNYQEYLIKYFPEAMQKKFSDEILNHPLKKEIIATLLTNDIVNHTGAYFFHILQMQTGVPSYEIAKAYRVVWQLFNLGALCDEASQIRDYRLRNVLLSEGRQFLCFAIQRLLHVIPGPLDVSKLLSEFEPKMQEIINQMSVLFLGDHKKVYDRKFRELLGKKVPHYLSVKVAKLNTLRQGIDIVLLSNHLNENIIDVANLFFKIGSRFHYDWLAQQTMNLPQGTYWDKSLTASLQENIYDQHLALAIKISEMLFSGKASSIDGCLKRNKKNVEKIDNLIIPMKKLEEMDYKKLVVAIHYNSSLLN